MKKAFSLFELIISISIFFIISIFLYDFFNNTKISNNKFEKNINKFYKTEDLKHIFYKDFFQASSISIENNSKNKQIIRLITKNSYHNPFYNNITYLLSNDNRLIRVESKKRVEKDNLSKEFFNTSYIDILRNNIEDFKLIKSSLNSKKYLLYIKSKKLDLKIPLLVF
ncbi:hypothetical protein [Arcobacter sp. CECT 8985]|uniref:hypothetical protein n=1 Tax=Arcobacter sp. CECT 8985 TaxID=1935424 RepID=UPI00100C215D|nr:hypothetical protein [Arcobacter sp. CECT 8985]RXJ86843.1 hypothetical protein CRU93_06470 [Arcobacter sp. CECT 8985]